MRPAEHQLKQASGGKGGEATLGKTP